MKFEFQGAQVYASTGGRKWGPDHEWIIFIHGAGQSHLTWSQQVRSFAYDGYNVFAPDLPAHGASDGPALDSAQAMADWLIGVMDDRGIARAHLVNHSMGGLISLEMASRHPARISSIVFIATALTIAVGDFLINAASEDQPKASAIMTSMGLSAFGHLHDNSVPGASLIGSGLEIMAANQFEALPADLKACASYRNGEAAAAEIQCPNLVLLAELDRMVAPRFGRKLADALPDSRLHVIQNSGHSLPAERPRETNQIIRDFYADISSQ